ncbi:MAG: Glu-tRNA(Gln) amidotransferase subunit GatE [Acidobacteriota bacterium]
MEGSIDYTEIGLRVGLEVHQQLLTERKMFCKCPAGLYTKTHDGAVLRHMRPTLSELGEYDGTALMEFKTRKNIVYLLHESNVCTYEMDDSPPFLVNPQAIDIAIELSLMMDCDIVDEVHIARKQYLDGSIPTGFQRTAIVGVNGSIPFRGRKLTVTQISVEEDSCREVLDRGHLIVWRADRLGMPLIETVTEPELTTPEEVEAAILLIGRICRSTDHVRVGLGASRQDVNVSVRGGQRVEIKGVPQAWRARQVVHGEAVRQLELLKLRDELHDRGFRGDDDIVVKHEDVTALTDRSQLDALRRETWEEQLAQSERQPELERGKGPFCVRAVRLVGLAGTLARPCQPDLTFAHEIAGRVRVIATLDQTPILLHSDAWPEYTGSAEELNRIRRALDCESGDALVVVWGAKQDTITAAQEIRNRYVDAVQGVPAETRQALDDGHTAFERILPGPDRMYPDTDSPPQRITGERVDAIRRDLPERPWSREERYRAAGLSESTCHYLMRRGGARLVDRVVAETAAELRRVGIFFGEEVKGWRRLGIDIDSIAEDRWLELFTLVAERPVLWQARRALVEAMVRYPERSVGRLVESFGSVPSDWNKQIEQESHRSDPIDDAAKQQRFLMGEMMKRLRGRVPASEVAEEIQTWISKSIP